MTSEVPPSSWFCDPERSTRDYLEGEAARPRSALPASPSPLLPGPQRPVLAPRGPPASLAAPSTVPRGRANIQNEGTVFHERTRKWKENCCLQSASQNCLKNKQKLSTPDAARGSFMRGARGASSFTRAPCAGFLCLRGVSWQWTVSTHPRGGVAEPALLCSVWPCVPWAEVIFCHYGLIPRP